MCEYAFYGTCFYLLIHIMVEISGQTIDNSRIVKKYLLYFVFISVIMSKRKVSLSTKRGGRNGSQL